MEIYLTRRDKNNKRTIGKLHADTLPEIHTLEDTDRGLTQDMTAEQIAAIKIPKQTAIPTGRYEIAITYSNRFKKRLPLLLKVPGFEGIRIHNGVTEHHTEGCILIGFARSFETISSPAQARFMAWLDATLKKEKVFINIQ